MMATEIFPETLLSFEHLTRPMIRKNFTEFGRREGFKSHIPIQLIRVLETPIRDFSHIDPITEIRISKT
jgi:hypothetical protein